MNPTPANPLLAARKVADLSALETRLHSAAIRARHYGFRARSASYLRQLHAVRLERQRWALVLNSPPAPAPAPHLLAGFFALLLPIVDWLVAGGVAAKRLARVVFTIGVVVCAVVIGTSPPSVWVSAGAPDAAPLHWVTDIARTELKRKNESPPLPVHPMSGRPLKHPS